MAGWLSGIDPADVLHVDIVRMELRGRPSCVAAADLRLFLRDGETALARVDYEHAPMYETFRDEIAAFNRWRLRQRG